jgi:putative heme iron utilization protein
MPREKFEFTVLNDDDFNDAADILEAITLWDRLADTFKTDKLRDQIKAIASESIFSHLIK